MGYYTFFELQVRRKGEADAPSSDKEIMNHIITTMTKYVEENNEVLKGFTDDLDDTMELLRNSELFAKNYEWHKNFCYLSTLFPDYVFVLWGDGDDKEDLWKTAFLNGEHGGGEVIYSYPELPEGW